MQKVHTQKGSAHVIIIVVLAVVLAGTLGFVFYQNFIAKKDTDTSTTASTATSSSSGTTSSSTTSTTTATTKLIGGSIDASFGTTLTFKYPETWTYSQKMSGTIETGGTWTQIITITSPSAKYAVQYQVGAGGGIGGVCVPDETGTLASIGYEAVPGFAGMSYVELIYNNMPSGSTSGDIALIDSTTAKSLKAGESTCTVGYSGVKQLSSVNSVQILNANMSISGATSASDIKAALSGREYDQAKAILLSTVH